MKKNILVGVLSAIAILISFLVLAFKDEYILTNAIVNEMKNLDTIHNITNSMLFKEVEYSVDGELLSIGVSDKLNFKDLNNFTYNINGYANVLENKVLADVALKYKNIQLLDAEILTEYDTLQFSSKKITLNKEYLFDINDNTAFLNAYINNEPNTKVKINKLITFVFLTQGNIEKFSNNNINYNNGTINCSYYQVTYNIKDMLSLIEKYNINLDSQLISFLQDNMQHSIGIGFNIKNNKIYTLNVVTSLNLTSSVQDIKREIALFKNTDSKFTFAYYENGANNLTAEVDYVNNNLNTMLEVVYTTIDGTTTLYLSKENTDIIAKINLNNTTTINAVGTFTLNEAEHKKINFSEVTIKNSDDDSTTTTTINAVVDIKNTNLTYKDINYDAATWDDNEKDGNFIKSNIIYQTIAAIFSVVAN